MDQHIARKIWDLIALVSGKPVAENQQNPDIGFATLGIDSLKLVQLVFEVETNFEIEIPEHLLFNLETVEELILLVMHYRKTAA